MQGIPETSGQEHFIITDHYDETGKVPAFEGFVLIGNYSNTFKIKKDENPVFSGFVLPDDVIGPESEKLNKLDLKKVVADFYDELFD